MNTCLSCGLEKEWGKCVNIFCEKSLVKQTRFKISTVFRSWYYIRQGYSTYLVFFIAITNLMITSYYLAIKDIPSLHNIFPNLYIFAIFVISLGIPTSLSLGYFHYKRSNAQHHQLEIEIESNPLTPIFLQTFIIVQKIIAGESLSNDDKRKIEFLNKRAESYFGKIKI